MNDAGIFIQKMYGKKVKMPKTIEIILITGRLIVMDSTQLTMGGQFNSVSKKIKDLIFLFILMGTSNNCVLQYFMN
jgi:hypothetical protein